MESDPHFYQLFRKCPEMVADLTSIDPDGGYSFSSRAYKRVDRTYDGILEPEDDRFPSAIIEFQVLPEDNVYPRIFMEMAGFQLEEPKRRVRGILIFPNRSCDPRTMPWRDFASCESGFQVVYLDEALLRLGEDHPLYAVFQPFLESNTSIVETKAKDWLNTIRNAPLSTDKIECLEEVFISWLTQRFKDLSKKEVMMRFGFDTPVEETVLYMEAKQEGLEEGEEKANKRALNAFETRLKTLLDKGDITPEVYQQEISAMRALFAGKHGEA
ncbi:MAG: DUF2887 domain-containing protein [Acidobacteriota bacterium]|nr:DUF2887 domain-containing protein [Acidobacteriota bacterium]